MTWSPRLVALDIDGTLFSAPHGSSVVDETISPAVLQAVARAVDADVPVVLATGRSTFGMTHVVELLDLRRRDPHGQVLAVASNGSVVFSHPPVEVLEAVTFDASDVVRRILDQMPQVLVAVEEVGVGYRVNRHFPDGEINGQITLQSVEELVAEPVTRVIVRDPESSEEDFHRLAEDAGLHDISYFIGWTAWLDLAPKGVSKASGLADVAARLGVPAQDVLAIGDGRNDIEMLQWAGRGVAMGQASDDVQAVADHVTDTVHADGVARELERWFPA
ncbi:HAD family hydrolase [Nocardioides marmoribigeumensis]|uniref:Cof subfamily protein (Haloacid dehalogenase superfamily) n=1 Tax=Nocardioides marmoribigeumensis TaxID=433649 RepID=A0ABU2BU99_9ACTN|nr:HAD family hydrolase [Nocardioides marmoribigeumensis]MDR7362207.1 Cof subfamily protein (haloacid dehalogenase superfamily) [Nocardioides marmoribigeumensis]